MSSLLKGTKAIEDDGHVLYTQPASAWREGLSIWPAAEERKHAATTVFGLEWGIVISDEVQGMRTLNKFYTACRMLRKRSDMIVGMSATPGITSPMVRFSVTHSQSLTIFQDFVAIGCFLGVPAFNVIGADDSIVEMRRALASAQRKDTAANKSDKKAAQRLTAMMSGKTGKGASSSVMQSTFVSVVQGYMDDFREKFADIVIRRTVNSLDYEDKPISGLPQYHEQIIALALTDAEHETFKKVVDALAEQAGSGKGFQPIRGGVSLISFIRFLARVTRRGTQRRP